LLRYRSAAVDSLARAHRGTVARTLSVWAPPFQVCACRVAALSDRSDCSATARARIQADSVTWLAGTARASAPPVARPSTTCEPRCPGHSALYQVVSDHFETFRAWPGGVFDNGRSVDLW